MKTPIIDAILNEQVRVKRWWNRLHKAVKMEILGIDFDVGPLNWKRLDKNTRFFVLQEYRRQKGS